MSAPFPIVDAHQHFWDLGRSCRFREIVSDFSAADQRMLFCGNAIRIYAMERA